MIKMTLVFSIVLNTILVIAQDNPVKVEILTQQQIINTFPDSIQSKAGISYPIRIVFRCKDKSGTFYIVLTETNDSTTREKDTLHYKIKALHIRFNQRALVKNWELNDFIQSQANSHSEETSIWFWTRYFSLADIDNDGLIDPIIVYGTSGLNGPDDGRIKILIYYKGKKVVIRHQNGSLDFERNTRIDQAFYSLPSKIQTQVKKLMTKMTEDNNAIFPNGWEKGMYNRKSFLKEMNRSVE